VAPSGLYARFCHAFLVFIFLMVDFLTPVSQKLIGRSSPTFKDW